MRPAESYGTMGTRQLNPLFQVLDGYQSLLEIDVAYLDTQRFRDTAAEMKQQTDKQSVPQVLR